MVDGEVKYAWDGSAIGTAGSSAAYIEVTSMGGATSITVKTGILAANATDVISATGTALTQTITTVGLYSCGALGNISYSTAGTTPAPTVNLMLKK